MIILYTGTPFDFLMCGLSIIAHVRHWVIIAHNSKLSTTNLLPVWQAWFSLLPILIDLFGKVISPSNNSFRKNIWFVFQTLHGLQPHSQACFSQNGNETTCSQFKIMMQIFMICHIIFVVSWKQGEYDSGKFQWLPVFVLSAPVHCKHCQRHTEPQSCSSKLQLPFTLVSKNSSCLKTEARAGWCGGCLGPFSVAQVIIYSCMQMRSPTPTYHDCITSKFQRDHYYVVAVVWFCTGFYLLHIYKLLIFIFK